MERALFIADLDRWTSPGEGAYDRLYLGSEFCAGRLPTPPALQRALRAAGDRGMSFSFVTPILDEPGLRRAIALVRTLPADGATEVIVNDLGLFEAIAEAGWRGAVVAGRLLTRQRRGPGFQDPLQPSPDARAALRGSALDAPPFIAWLAATYGVRRFELDDLVQGVAVGPLPEGIHLSIYRPWLIVTVTRNCPWIFDGRFRHDIQGCPRPCRGRALRLEPAEGGRPLLMGGCAQFLLGDEGAGFAGPSVDRAVWQPDIPA